MFLCAGLSGAQASLINGINVVVNDTVITYDQVESGIVPVAETLSAQYRSDRLAFEKKLQELRNDRIEKLVQDQLILNEFKTAGYGLPESFIEDAIRDRIRRDFYGDRARLTKTLQQEGVTYEMFRQQEREKIIIDAMREHNVSPKKITISPSKIENYYNGHQDDFKVGDQVKLRMIVINQTPLMEPGAAKRMAEEVLAKIDQGVPFAEMASVYSSGAQRSDGGDRGWVDRSYFKAELANAAFSLKAGQHSGVVELAEACYLLQVDDVRPAHVRGLAEVRAEIENTLKIQELKRLQSRWIERLRAKSFVRYY